MNGITILAGDGSDFLKDITKDEQMSMIGKALGQPKSTLEVALRDLMEEHALSSISVGLLHTTAGDYIVNCSAACRDGSEWFTGIGGHRQNIEQSLGTAIAEAKGKYEAAIAAANAAPVAPLPGDLA